MGGFIYFILVGALAGWLVGTLFKGGGFGILGNIVVGIIGGILGGWVLVFWVFPPMVGSWVQSLQQSSAAVCWFGC